MENEFDARSLKQKISITIDSDILKEVKKYAYDDNRSLSQFINLALMDYVKSRKEREN